MRSFHHERAAKASQLTEKIAELRGQGRNVRRLGDRHGRAIRRPTRPPAHTAALRRSHTQLRQEILGAIRQATQNAAARRRPCNRYWLTNEGR